MESHVHAEKTGALGLLTLARPQALNALTHGMINALHERLTAWAADDSIKAVAIRGEGRAFCAGGDIRAWVAAGRDAALAFLRAEYQLNHRIATYPKPFVALMHGVTMGGGAGLSVHARHRLADPGLVLAMPETAIGFVPDVGSTWFLPRCPEGLGLYLALTAARMGQGDAIAAGLADSAVALADFEAFLEALARGKKITRAIEAVAGMPGPAPLAAERTRIATLFTAASVEGVLERLVREGSIFACQAAAAIRANSPTSLKLAFHLLCRGATLDLRQCLAQEYRAAMHLLARHDLKEGVRAALIDKDRAPKWQPSALAAVTEAGIAGLMADEAEIPAFE